jgi:putative ATPase
MYDGLILIIDEIHRMNKDKQDLLLSYLESGIITLIGLTSSNPYHSINPAIRSRCQILELKPISNEDIIKAIKGVKKILPDLKLDKITIEYIASLSNGDLRYAYNLIEFCYYSFGPSFGVKDIEEINTKSNLRSDKNEDEYYNAISAFQKSIRGSDVNASLHYLARLIEAGDYDIIYRRMLAICYEDIGLANPSMGPKVIAAIEAAERIGYPELILPLSNIVIDMALSPKSNSAYLAIHNAINRLNEGNIDPVPNNISSHPINYIYPHDYPPYYYVKQQYLPKNIERDIYYKPKNNKYEIELNKYNQIRKESLNKK